MCSSENGFTSAMRKVATGGYMQMPCYHGSFNQDLLREVEYFKPDLIFMQFQNDGVITEETAIKLAEKAFVINFNGDKRSELPEWHVRIGKHIHLSTFSNMEDVYRMRAFGCSADYLEIGFDPQIYTKRDIQKQSPSIVAHFNHYPNMFPLSDYRMQIVDRLRAEFGNEFGVWGSYPNANGNFNSDQLAESMNYNRAKISISVSHFNSERYASDRLLRAVGSATMCLSHNYKGIEMDWKVGEHLDVFDSIDELVEKCRYYLKNEEKREEIAQKGFEHCHKMFTFDKMCENVISLYKFYKK